MGITQTLSYPEKTFGRRSTTRFGTITTFGVFTTVYKRSLHRQAELCSILVYVGSSETRIHLGVQIWNGTWGACRIQSCVKTQAQLDRRQHRPRDLEAVRAAIFPLPGIRSDSCINMPSTSSWWNLETTRKNDTQSTIGRKQKWAWSLNTWLRVLLCSSRRLQGGFTRGLLCWLRQLLM